jgi:hypothetical protein
LGSHECWLEASICVIQQHGSRVFILLPFDTVNCVATL